MTWLYLPPDPLPEPKTHASSACRSAPAQAGRIAVTTDRISRNVGLTQLQRSVPKLSVRHVVPSLPRVVPKLSVRQLLP